MQEQLVMKRPWILVAALLGHATMLAADASKASSGYVGSAYTVTMGTYSFTLVQAVGLIPDPAMDLPRLRPAAGVAGDAAPSFRNPEQPLRADWDRLTLEERLAVCRSDGNQAVEVMAGNQDMYTWFHGRITGLDQAGSYHGQLARLAIVLADGKRLPVRQAVATSIGFGGANDRNAPPFCFLVPYQHSNPLADFRRKPGSAGGGGWDVFLAVDTCRPHDVAGIRLAGGVRSVAADR
jgi:hypothetical protein